MEVKLDSLIAFERVKSEPEKVFALVDKYNVVVLLQDNKPAYIIAKYTDEINESAMPAKHDTSGLKLHEAMRTVLLDINEHTMHAADLANEIFNRNLYRQKNGEKARYNQIRARCSHYPDMFEALPGNMIRLKEEAK